MVERDLAGLAQLEQREERDRLVDARERSHLRVEIEASAAAKHGAEALEELGNRREAERHVRERDLRRRLGKQPQHCRELLRILLRELALGPRRKRRRADTEVAVALAGESLGQPAGGPYSNTVPPAYAPSATPQESAVEEETQIPSERTSKWIVRSA